MPFPLNWNTIKLESNACWKVSMPGVCSRWKLVTHLEYNCLWGLWNKKVVGLTHELIKRSNISTISNYEPNPTICFSFARTAYAFCIVVCLLLYILSTSWFGFFNSFSHLNFMYKTLFSFQLFHRGFLSCCRHRWSGNKT